MFSLRKLLPWPLGSKDEEETKRAFILDAGERAGDNKANMLIIGIVLVVGVGIVALWVVSLLSPDFDITPTELGPRSVEEEQVTPIADAVQEIGSLIEETPKTQGLGIEPQSIAEILDANGREAHSAID